MGRRLNWVEFIRFALLATVTVAGLAVAARIGDHDTTAGHVPVTPTASASPNGQPGGSGSGPNGSGGQPGHHLGHHGAGPTTPDSTGTGAGSGTGTGTGSSGAGASNTSYGGSTQQVSGELPRSGAALATIAAVAALLVVGGASAVAAAGRRP